jgi:hypothetical protein
MNSSTSRIVGFGFAAFLLLLGAADRAWAATIVAAKTDNLLHNQTNSPFFTLSTNGTTALAAADGWAPIAPTQAAAATTTSTTPKKSFSFVGNSTAAGDWLDGNGVPAGITLTFDAQLTISASPTGLLLTVPGATGTTLGQGIGVTGTVGGNNDINTTWGIQVSPVTVSNVSFTGALTDPNYTFAPGGVGGFGTIVIRSSTFNNSTAGMVLTQGSDTIGFGVATGTIASNQVATNNFGTGSPASSIFPRQSGPYTLIATQGVSVIKGIGLGYDVTYGITAVPEPATLVLAFVGLLATCFSRRSGHTR